MTGPRQQHEHLVGDSWFLEDSYDAIVMDDRSRKSRSLKLVTAPPKEGDWFDAFLKGIASTENSSKHPARDKILPAADEGFGEAIFPLELKSPVKAVDERNSQELTVEATTLGFIIISLFGTFLALSAVSSHQIIDPLVGVVGVIFGVTFATMGIAQRKSRTYHCD